MQRSAVGADGREWTVRTQVEWREPATAQGFEHDIAGGEASAAVMILILVVLVVALFAWMPSSVVLPIWVVLAIVAVALFFPIRWVLNRPWRVVAETAGNMRIDKPAERWVGVMRGMLAVRGEVWRVRRAIERQSAPMDDGILRPVE